MRSTSDREGDEEIDGHANQPNDVVRRSTSDREGGRGVDVRPTEDC
jgi:hypothetical protein